MKESRASLIGQIRHAYCGFRNVFFSWLAACYFRELASKKLHRQERVAARAGQWSRTDTESRLWLAMRIHEQNSQISEDINH